MGKKLPRSCLGKRVAALLATCCLLLVALGIVKWFHGAGATTSPGFPAVDPATSCGPVSLSIVTHWLGMPRGIVELSTLAHADDTGTSSLLELKQAAERIGLAAEGVRLNPRRPFPYKLPMILHLKHHFAAVLPVDGDSVVLVDPPMRPRVVRRGSLAENWDGVLLVFAGSRKELDIALSGNQLSNRKE